MAVRPDSMGAAYQALPGLLNGLLMIFPGGLLAAGRGYHLNDAADRVVKEILAWARRVR